jgi:protein-disulfide isomerase
MKQTRKNTSLITRRAFFGAGAASAAISILPTGVLHADDMLEKALSPRVIGNADAPIHVAEYYSMTCGHCADFHNNTYPKVKAKLIDEGIVRLELRPFPLDGLALRAHALVRAVPETKFFPLVKMLLAKQPVWARAADPVAELQKLARLAGIGTDEFNGIMQNRPLLEGIVSQRQKGIDKWQISSTPSFVVNDDSVLAGNMSYEEFAEALSAYGA